MHPSTHLRADLRHPWRHLPSHPRPTSHEYTPGEIRQAEAFADQLAKLSSHAADRALNRWRTLPSVQGTTLAHLVDLARIDQADEAYEAHWLAQLDAYHEELDRLEAQAQASTAAP